MLFCTICGEHYHAVGSDRIDICAACWRENFAGSQELRHDAPRVAPAREALEAYVDSGRYEQLTPSQEEALEDYALALNNRQLSLTPRQVQAMRRMQERWQAQREDD